MHTSIEQIRQNLLRKRAEFSKNPDFSKTNSDLLLHVEHFLANPRQDFESIGFYWPYKHEPDLMDPLLRWQKLKQNRKLLLSAVRPDKQLDFYTWSQSTPLKMNGFGIPEPDPSSPDVVLLKPDCIFIPCVGWRQYESRFWRLGYGGGYFDRTIDALKNQGQSFKTVGIAYDWQELVEGEWAPQSHDEPLDYVLSNSGLRP
jgi:5,10-methenyltetrahydrofolate synthetase